MSNLARGATIIAIIALAVVGTFVGFELGDADGNDADTGNRYQVHIDFNETVTSADMTEVQDVLREYDADVELMILESFPPQGSAIVETTDAGFCIAIVAELEAKSYVSGASCEPWTPAGDDGDEPVSTDNAG
jgi:hypothetical protein